MEIQTFTFNPFLENTYVLYDASGECIIIDSGCYDDGERTKLVNFIDKEQFDYQENFQFQSTKVYQLLL